MSSDFEKNISHHLEGFRLSPAPQVWERVAAALPEKRRRRFAVWWLLPLAACLGVGAWLTINQQKGTDNKRITNTAGKTTGNDNNFKKIIHPPVDTAGHELQPDDAQKTAANENRTGAPPKQDGAKEEVAASYPVPVSKPFLQMGTIAETHQKNISLPGNTLLKRHSGTPVTQTEELLYVLNNTAGNTAIQKAGNNDSVFLNKQPHNLLIDSANILLLGIIAKNDTTLDRRSDTLSRNLVEIKDPKTKNKNRNAEWCLLVGVGKSSLSHGSSNMDKSLYAANYTNSGGQASSPGGVFNNPTAGFNGSIGVVRRQTISKHISWQAEASYQFLTTKQRVGNRNDSLLLYDAFANAAFYRTSSTVSDLGTAIQPNRVHRLQIAPGFLCILNPQARSPFRFFAGATVAYTFSNHLLLHDYGSGSYIRSAKLSNKLMFGGAAGMDVFINHFIQAGLFYQHDFTNVAKPKAGSAFHWSQLQLRIGVPLSKYK